MGFAVKKIAHQPLINLRTRQKLVTPASYKEGMAKMMHLINPAKNESKFYEMVIVPKDDGTVGLIKSHGGLTDNPNKIRFWEDSHPNMDAALAEMQKMTREKLRKGYKDTFRENRGQYPIGLTREVGFGWDTQEVTKTPVAIPAFQGLLHKLDSAIDAGERMDQEGMSIALAEVSRILFDMPASSMAKDLQSKLSTPAKQLLSGEVNPKRLSRALKTVRNSIKNQLSEVSRMASARSALIKLASSLPAGSSERRTILASLQQKTAFGPIIGNPQQVLVLWANKMDRKINNVDGVIGIMGQRDFDTAIRFIKEMMDDGARFSRENIPRLDEKSEDFADDGDEDVDSDAGSRVFDHFNGHRELRKLLNSL